jgi:hypothetical protein
MSESSDGFISSDEPEPIDDSNYHNERGLYNESNYKA